MSRVVRIGDPAASRSLSAREAAFVNEAGRHQAMRRVAAKHPGLAVRLVAVPWSEIGDFPELRDGVRGVRRRQPSRRSDGTFCRDSELVPFGNLRVLAVWAIHWSPNGFGEEPWFAGHGIWTPRSAKRMAALFLDAADPLPVLAFDPFAPGLVQEECIFRWEAVRADGSRFNGGGVGF